MQLSNIQQEFPFIQEHPELIFLDNAASAQKPKVVLDAIQDFYVHSYANIHRGSYPRADEATDKYEWARKQVATLVNASSSREIIFMKNATEATNLVARSLFDGKFLEKGDRVLVSHMEHHSNIVPWLHLKQYCGVEVDFIPFTDDKEFDYERYLELLEQENVKLVAFTHVSNTLGTVNDAKKICAMAKEKGALSFIDGAQSVPHFKVDVQDIACDFYSIAGHKMYGPSGVGMLYGRLDLLKEMPPFLGGGSMIHEVFTSHYTPGEVPAKFEAGTPAIAECYATGVAAKFLMDLDLDQVEAHDKELSAYAYKKISQIPEITIFSHKNAMGLITFTVKGVHDYDIGDELGERNICVRVGHHCAQPLMDDLEVSTTIRASFGVYTKKEDIDTLVQALKEIIADYC